MLTVYTCVWGECACEHVYMCVCVCECKCVCVYNIIAYTSFPSLVHLTKW